MFVVTLKFSNNKAQAAQHMETHKAWIERGFTDGVFLLTGSLSGGEGGAVLAHSVSLNELETRVQQDPFVIHQIVNAEILEIAPGRMDQRLAFLKA